MRYLDEVTFIQTVGEHYDPNLGETAPGEVVKTTVNVNVTDLGTNRSIALFGDIRQGAKVIRTQPLFVLPKFDTVEFQGRAYKETTVRSIVARHSLIVEEVVADG